MNLKLFGNFLSQPSRALYIFMKKCEIPFEHRVVDLKSGEHYTEEFAKINPLQKVPVIEHNGVFLMESIAILRYLCREFKVKDHWYPSSSLQQAKVDEYLEWQHNNTRAHCALYFRHLLIVPAITGKKPSTERVEKLEKNMNECLDLIENIWLSEKPYLAGDKISVADLIGACEIEQPRMCGYDPCKGRPRLTKWLERIRSETDPYYAEAHQILNKIAQKRLTEQQKPQNLSML